MPVKAKIGKIDPENKTEVVEKLRKMLKDEKEAEAVKHGVADGLAAMGGEAKDALPDLRDLAGGSHQRVLVGRA